MGNIVTGKTGAELPWNWASKGRRGPKGSSRDSSGMKKTLAHLCHDKEAGFQVASTVVRGAAQLTVSSCESEIAHRTPQGHLTHADNLLLPPVFVRLIPPSYLLRGPLSPRHPRPPSLSWLPSLPLLGYPVGPPDAFLLLVHRLS